jgi:hypothetical protein
MVEIIKKYTDKELKRTVEIGEQLKVSAERAKVLINAGVAKKLPVVRKQTRKKKDEPK